MTTQTLPKLRNLKEAGEHLNVPPHALRKAVQAGELPCFRLTDGCSAKIMLADDDLREWLHTKCAARSQVLSPAQTRKAMRGE